LIQTHWCAGECLCDLAQLGVANGLFLVGSAVVLPKNNNILMFEEHLEHQKSDQHATL
jgi:hypothetical protein